MEQPKRKRRAKVRNVHAVANAARRKARIKGAKNPKAKQVATIVDSYAGTASVLPCNRGLVLALNGEKGPATLLHKIIMLMALSKDEAGWAYHHEEDFAQELCVSVKTIARWKARLKQLGVLEFRFARGQRVSYYRIDPNRLENLLMAAGVKTGKEEAGFVKARKHRKLPEQSDRTFCPIDNNRESRKDDHFGSPEENQKEKNFSGACGAEEPPATAETPEGAEGVTRPDGSLDKNKCLTAARQHESAQEFLALFPPGTEWIHRSARSFFYRLQHSRMTPSFLRYLRDTVKAQHPGLFIDPAIFLAQFRCDHWHAQFVDEVAATGARLAEEIAAYEEEVPSTQQELRMAKMLYPPDTRTDDEMEAGKLWEGDYPDTGSRRLFKRYADAFPYRFAALILTAGQNRDKWYNTGSFDPFRFFPVSSVPEDLADADAIRQKYSDTFSRCRSVVEEFVLTRKWVLDQLHHADKYWDLNVEELKAEAEARHAKRLELMKNLEY